MKKNKLKLFLGGLAMTLVLVGCSNVNSSDVKGEVGGFGNKDEATTTVGVWTNLSNNLNLLRETLFGVADNNSLRESAYRRVSNDNTTGVNANTLEPDAGVAVSKFQNVISDAANVTLGAPTNVLDKSLFQENMNEAIYRKLATQCGKIISNQLGDTPHIAFVTLNDVVAKEQGAVEFQLDKFYNKKVKWTVLPSKGLTFNIDENTGSATYSAEEAGRYTAEVFIADAETDEMYDYKKFSFDATSPFAVLGYNGVSQALKGGSFSFTLGNFNLSYNNQPIGFIDVTLEIGQGNGFRAGYATYTPENLAGEIQEFLQGASRTYVYSIEVDKNYTGAWMIVPLTLHHQNHSIHHDLKIRIVDNQITVDQIPFIMDSFHLVSKWYKDLMESWQKDDTSLVRNSTTYMAYVEKLLTFLTDEERITVNKYLTTMVDNYETETGYYIPFVHDMVKVLFNNVDTNATENVWIAILKGKLMAWTYNQEQMEKEMGSFVNYVIKHWNTNQVYQHLLTYGDRYVKIMEQAFADPKLSQALSSNETLKFLMSDFVQENWVKVLNFTDPTSFHDSLNQLIEQYHMSLGLVQDADVSTFALTRLNNTLYHRGFYNLLWQYGYMDNAHGYARLGHWVMVDKEISLLTILGWPTDKAMFESKLKVILDEYTKTNQLDPAFRLRLDSRVMRFMNFAVQHKAELEKIDLFKNRVKENYKKTVTLVPASIAVSDEGAGGSKPPVTTKEIGLSPLVSSSIVSNHTYPAPFGDDITIEFTPIDIVIPSSYLFTSSPTVQILSNGNIISNREATLVPGTTNTYGTVVHLTAGWNLLKYGGQLTAAATFTTTSATYTNLPLSGSIIINKAELSTITIAATPKLIDAIDGISKVTLTAKDNNNNPVPLDFTKFDFNVITGATVKDPTNDGMWNLFDDWVSQSDGSYTTTVTANNSDVTDSTVELIANYTLPDNTTIQGQDVIAIQENVLPTDSPSNAQF